jgi:hypothetical protein
MAMRRVPDEVVKVWREFGVPRRGNRVMKKLGPKPSHCAVCGKPETSDNPLQAAHRVSYKHGCLAGWHPEVLNAPENLVWAHRSKCNRAVEMLPPPSDPSADSEER